MTSIHDVALLSHPSFGGPTFIAHQTFTPYYPAKQPFDPSMAATFVSCPRTREVFRVSPDGNGGMAIRATLKGLEIHALVCTRLGVIGVGPGVLYRLDFLDLHVITSLDVRGVNTGWLASSDGWGFLCSVDREIQGRMAWDLQVTEAKQSHFPVRLLLLGETAPGIGEGTALKSYTKWVALGEASEFQYGTWHLGETTSLGHHPEGAIALGQRGVLPHSKEATGGYYRGLTPTADYPGPDATGTLTLYEGKNVRTYNLDDLTAPVLTNTERFDAPVRCIAFAPLQASGRYIGTERGGPEDGHNLDTDSEVVAATPAGVLIAGEHQPYLVHFREESWAAVDVPEPEPPVEPGPATTVFYDGVTATLEGWDFNGRPTVESSAEPLLSLARGGYEGTPYITSSAVNTLAEAGRTFPVTGGVDVLFSVYMCAQNAYAPFISRLTVTFVDAAGVTKASAILETPATHDQGFEKYSALFSLPADVVAVAIWVGTYDDNGIDAIIMEEVP